MKKLLKISFVFIILFVCFFAGGCSVQHNVRLSEQGIIESEVYFDLSNLETAKIDKINGVVKTYYRQLDKAYKENLINLFANIYDFSQMKDENGNELEEISKYKYIISKHMKFFDGDDIEKDRAYAEFNEGKKFVITKTFASFYAYILYFNPSAFKFDETKKEIVIVESYNSLIDVPISSDGVEKEKGLFINKYIQTCSPFYYNGEVPKFLYDDTMNKISKGATLEEILIEKAELTKEQVNLIFSFTSPYNRLHSNGEFKVTDKGFTHTWTLSSLNDKITFTRIYSNQTMWYVVAGASGIVALILSCIVAIFINRHNKKVGLQVLKQIDDFTKANKFKIKK